MGQVKDFLFKNVSLFNSLVYKDLFSTTYRYQFPVIWFLLNGIDIEKSGSGQDKRCIWTKDPKHFESHAGVSQYVKHFFSNNSASRGIPKTTHPGGGHSTASFHLGGQTQPKVEEAELPLRTTHPPPFRGSRGW